MGREVIAALADALLWPLLGLLGLIVTGLGAWALGRREGTQKARTDTAERNTKSAQAAKENRNELESQDDQHLIDVLTRGRKLRD